VYSRNRLGIWESPLPPDAQIDQTRALLSAGADLMNLLQQVLDEVRGLRGDVQQLALFPQVVEAATPGETPPSRWIGEVPKEKKPDDP